MVLKDKTIIIVSQEDWGKMFISKHHYAVELSKLGNTVYFLNSPDQDELLKKGEVKIDETSYSDLFVINHRFSFPYKLKFRFRALFEYLVSLHVKKILSAVNRQVDIVWSFDLSDTIPLKSFKGVNTKIFMAADYPTKQSIKGAAYADLILSTNFSDEFLEEKFSEYSVTKKFISHGVTEKFFPADISELHNNPLQVGMSGNFLRHDIDWNNVLKVMDENSQVQFNFWGATDFKSSNVGYAEGAHLELLKAAMSRENANFHGVVSSDELSGYLKKMDAFLICYDISKDYSQGTNYHKVLEYLATGKVVVANNMSSYKNTPGIIQMPDDKSNESLSAIFSNVINNIAKYNSMQMQQKRMEYAKQFTYRNNILKIGELLN